ncbi:MAG TPA: LpqB family beta-propeller domain-containing protein [Gemmatimonadales bacterium]|nr:LpqB family beta-propeller domain-containing protein [Gemmatimonadales bacterium]
MQLPRRLLLVILPLLGACSGSPVPPPRAPAPAIPSTETISIRVAEGTALALDVAADGRIAFDLLGQLWEMRENGGAARPLTDAVRDTAEDSDPSYSPDGRRIVFRAERHGRTGLWLLEGDGPPRQLTQLADPDGFEGSAAWSPDGGTIVFSRVAPVTDGSAEWASTLELLDPDGGSTRRLRIEGVPSSRVRDPAWHPDGERIAFVEAMPRVGAGGRLWVVGRDGGTATPLTPEGTAVFAPAFAPEGRRIAYFAADSSGVVQVWVQDATRDAKPIPLTSHADVSPTRIRWTPDGHVVYAADGRIWKIAWPARKPVEVPFTAELTFQRPRRELPQAHFPVPGRAEPARGFTGLALAPDGARIAMLALGKLWVMPVDGRPRAVTDVPPSARHLTWSPGGIVAWSAGRFGEEDIHAADVASGATYRVTAMPGREVFPAFSPDGRHIAFVHEPGGGAAHLRVASARVRNLDEVSDTKLLDSLALPWTASTADVPVWSPRSDALLRTAGGWSPGSPTEGIETALDGKRRTLAGFPDSPLYMRWTPNGLAYIRHARLWLAPVAAESVHSPIPLGADPAMFLSAAADGTLLFVSEGGLRLRETDGRERRLGWPLSYTPPTPRPLLIRNARIVDGTGAPATAPRDILLEGGRVAAIAPVGALDGGSRRDPAREVLDAAGGYVMPGLVDLHAHLYRPDLAPGFLYFGITTLRDQGAPLAPLVAHAEGVASGAFAGPRLAYGGFQLYTDWAWDTEDGLGIEPEADSGHAARSIALAALFGAQHVKTRTFRRWDINARLVMEGHRRGMRATGHCAHPLPLVAAGIDAQEHIGFCPPRGGGAPYDDIVQLYRAGGIAVVPTISYPAFAARLERAAMLDADAEVRPFLPEPGSFGWMTGMDSARRREMNRAANGARQAARTLSRAGVTVGTGTDIWQLPTGVHMEMEELVAAGLSPLEAIRAATLNAARIMGAEEDLGTVEVGKLADLVILDRDPTAEIWNTRRITHVIQGGRVVDRRRLRERHH